MHPMEILALEMLDRSWLIPRGVKKAVRFEWERDNTGTALTYLLAYQTAFTIVSLVLMFRLIDAVRP